jgi:hypothetical protein
VSTYNLGDSGWMHLRLGAGNVFGSQGHRALWGLISQSDEQTHFFNCPFQLGTDSGDLASDGAVKDVGVLPGDMLLLSTDGLFDNLFEHEIAAHLSQINAEACMAVVEAAREGRVTAKGLLDAADMKTFSEFQACKTSLGVAASTLAVQAQIAGSNTQRKSPFSVGANKHGYSFQGGKLDDVAVVLALVLPPVSA